LLLAQALGLIQDVQQPVGTVAQGRVGQLPLLEVQLGLLAVGASNAQQPRFAGQMDEVQELDDGERA